MRIKKGDQVRIIKGRDRGKNGKVLKVDSENMMISVEGVNLVKKHMKPKKSGEKGQRVEIPSMMNAANAMLICPMCGKFIRVEYSINNNIKTRICKKCKGEI